MRFKFFAGLALFTLSAISLFAQTPAADASARLGYLVGPGDVLSIKVLGEPTFDIEALTVDEDGMIVIPFSQAPIAAKCKTERALQADVAKAWSKYLRNPQVNLRVSKRDSRPPVSVFGEVRGQAAKFDLTRRVQLLELISYAGGETEKSGGTVQVFRTTGPMCSSAGDPNDWASGSSNESGVPLREFSLAEMRKGRLDANPEIIPGDVVVVQKASPVYVIGEVIRPGELNLPDGGLPLTQAIAMASGVNREAKTKSVKIYRKKVGAVEPEVLAINYDQIRKGLEKDIMLQPMDIVEVGKAPKSFKDVLLDFIIGVPQKIPLPIRPI